MMPLEAQVSAPFGEVPPLNCMRHFVLSIDVPGKSSKKVCVQPDGGEASSAAGGGSAAVGEKAESSGKPPCVSMGPPVLAESSKGMR
jgi:hypothetical protein